jgi:hypothetical protein
MFESVDTKSDYVIVVPGLILSEHSSVAEARRGRSAAVAEGFVEVSIMRRTPDGWKTFVEQQSKGDQSFDGKRIR